MSVRWDGEVRWWRLATVLVIAVTLASVAHTQKSIGAEDRTATGAFDMTEAGTDSDTPPALFTIGLTGGFPSYQTAALALSFQAQYVGLQVKGSWTAAGPFIGAQLRGYPPIPVPVPVYLGVGAGVYGPNASYHAAIGTHVPLGRTARLDVEGGVASVPLLDGRAWAPHVAVGVSYAVPLPTGRDGSTSASGAVGAPSSAGGSSSAPRGGACTEDAAPDETTLMAAFRSILRQWIDSARATYGSVYTDLDYGYDVEEASIQGEEGRLRVRYRGSVREIATGTRHEASGEASATFRWTGCAWRNTGVDY